jgi:putative flippase GtrA
MQFASPLPQDMSHVLRFVVVGSAGFVADAAILILLIERVSLGQIEARLVSAPAAIVFTFALNRSWSFSDLAQPSIVRSFASYISVQGFGFLFNFLVYSLIAAIVPKPAVALAVASLAAMMLNYVGARYWAFRA